MAWSRGARAKGSGTRTAKSNNWRRAAAPVVALLHARRLRSTGMGAGGQEDSCSGLFAMQQAGLHAAGPGWSPCRRLVSTQQAGLHAAGWSPCSLCGACCCLIACSTAQVHWHGGWRARGLMQQAGLYTAGWSSCSRLVSIQQAGHHAAGWSLHSRLVSMQQAQAGRWAPGEIIRVYDEVCVRLVSTQQAGLHAADSGWALGAGRNCPSLGGGMCPCALVRSAPAALSLRLA